MLLSFPAVASPSFLTAGWLKCSMRPRLKAAQATVTGLGPAQKAVVAGAPDPASGAGPAVQSAPSTSSEEVSFRLSPA